MNNWITTTLLATVATAGGIAEADKKTSHEAALKQRIEAFKDAGDTRDIDGIGKVLHKDFRLIAYFGDAADGMVMDKAGYTGALAAGKMGGTKRELSIVSLDVRGSRAAVHIRMSSKALKFDNFMHWVLTADGWQLLNDLAHAVPVK